MATCMIQVWSPKMKIGQGDNVRRVQIVHNAVRFVLGTTVVQIQTEPVPHQAT